MFGLAGAAARTLTATQLSARNKSIRFMCFI